jgi:NDP-sugar pyrophosphorylase family protein
VILSAGKGSRIDPFNVHFPKPMLPVCNRPILEHQIDQMKAIGIREVIIVVGHLKESIQEHFGDGSALGVSIRYVEQKATLGIAHAVMQLERHVDRAFLLYLGDILYVPKDLGSMVEIAEREQAVVVLAAKKEPDREAIYKNFLVDADVRGRVSRVIEKPRWLVNDLKGCGIYYFQPDFFDAVRLTPRTALRDEYEITHAIQISIDLGHKVFVAPVVEWDLNITFAGDILVGNRYWRERLGLSNLIAEGAVIDPGARLSGAIVGRGARIRHPIALDNVVVFAGADVDTREDLADCLFFRDQIVRCKAAVDAGAST